MACARRVLNVQLQQVFHLDAVVVANLTYVGNYLRGIPLPGRSGPGRRPEAGG